MMIAVIDKKQNVQIAKVTVNQFNNMKTTLSQQGYQVVALGKVSQTYGKVIVIQ